MPDKSFDNEHQKGERMPRHKLSYRTKRRFGLIAFFLALILAVGVVGGAMMVLSPNIQTQTAVPATMTDSTFAQGFVVLDETPIVSSETGHLYFTANNGERIPAGSAVAEVYSNRSAAEARALLKDINEEIDLLQQAQSTYVASGDVEGLLQQRQDLLLKLMDAMDTANYDNLQKPLAEVTLAANKLQVAIGETVDYSAQIEQLEAQRQQCEAQIQESLQSTVSAPASGYFVVSEKYDRVLLDYNTLKDASTQEVQLMMHAPPQLYPSDVVGHIISDYKWYFFALLPLEQSDKFFLNRKLQITFPDYSESSLPVKVHSVQHDESTGLMKVEFLCEYINPQVLALRFENAQIIFSVQNGIRIDKRALRIRNGEPGVFIKSGNLVRYRKIEILLEDENYLLIPAEIKPGANEVQMYDEIIVDNGGLELNDMQIL